MTSAPLSPPPLPPRRYTGYFSEGQLRGIMRQLFAGLGYLHMCLSCPAGFSLLSEYVLLPSDDGHVLLAPAADPAGASVQPPLPLSASFTLISVDLHVRIADFGLARECVAPRPHAARFRDADAGTAGAIKSTWSAPIWRRP